MKKDYKKISTTQVSTENSFLFKKKSQSPLHLKKKITVKILNKCF